MKYERERERLLPKMALFNALDTLSRCEGSSR